MNRSLPALVLIHGGAHAADCWDLTIAELRRQAPELPVLAVDLPGRGAKPGELTQLGVEDFVDSVVADVGEMGFVSVVIVAHSMGGLTAPRVTARLGYPFVRELICIAAFVPAPGSSVAETMGGPLGWLARVAVALGRPFPLPYPFARIAFWNGMTRTQRRFAQSRLHLEALRVLVEPAADIDVPKGVPITWILTRRDRALSVRRQQRAMTALGGVDNVVEIDTCHDAMISRPGELAAILLHRWRLSIEASD
ncbi:alpha/beta fold hydrolase [Mycobacterium sp. 48b]|uniref:alpha/beta fold hydrolase n=1 Tax=Mycobacterium sp. 48b TaxID=3400426 RepID=UPI003AADF68B